jgi:hypothetical protein
VQHFDMKWFDLLQLPSPFLTEICSFTKFGSH